MYFDNVSKTICRSYDWIIVLNLVKPRNRIFHTFFYNLERFRAHASNFLYYPTNASFPYGCFSPCIIILRACLMVSTVMREFDTELKYIRALTQFITCLQKMIAILGKRSTTFCHKFHDPLKEKLHLPLLLKHMFMCYLNKQNITVFCKLFSIGMVVILSD